MVEAGGTDTSAKNRRVKHAQNYLQSRFLAKKNSNSQISIATLGGTPGDLSIEQIEAKIVFGWP